MVFQGDSQVPAHVGKLCWVELPDNPRQLHGAEELPAGRFDVFATAAGQKHRPVEFRVVRGDEVEAIGRRLNCRPQLTERGFAPNPSPCDAVESRELECLSGRANVEVNSAPDDSAFDPDHSNGASTVEPLIRNLEVDRGEGEFARRNQSPPHGRGATRPAAHSQREPSVRRTLLGTKARPVAGPPKLTG